MTARRILPAFASLAMIAALSGCGSGGMAMPKDLSSFSSVADAVKSLSGKWDLSSLQGMDISKLLPAGSKVPNLNIANDGKVSGFGGVNNLMSSLDLEALTKGKFQLAPVASTKMAGPAEAMKVENQFTSLLNQAKSFGLSGDTLSLKGENGSKLMDFVKSAAK